MEKFEYVDAKNKICVVVLKDHWGSTVAKGISRCSEDDTFTVPVAEALKTGKLSRTTVERNLAELVKIIIKYKEI